MIDFNTTPENRLPEFKGGVGELVAAMSGDGLCRILRGRLASGHTIGEHCHDTSCEVIYFLSGRGRMILDGEEERIAPGLCHYCPKGSTHQMINDSSEELVFFAVVPQQ